MLLAAPPARIRDAHVPAAHPCVRHLGPLLDDGVEVLPEPAQPEVSDGRGPATQVGDDKLGDQLGSLDVRVLAYRYATHSDFVEACYDLGTAVVAPRVGFIAEQHRVHTYDLGVPGSLTQALAGATSAPADVAPEGRLSQRVYAALLARTAVS